MSEVYHPLRTETPAQEVDRHMADLRVLIQRREHLMRLLNNSDFKALFLKFYLVDEAARLVQLSGQLGLNALERADCVAMGQATGHFKRFMDVIERQGEQAIANLSQYQEQYEELTMAQEEAE